MVEFVASDTFDSVAFRGPSRQFLSAAVRGAVALALSGLAVVWILQRLPDAAVVRAPLATGPAAVAANPYSGLFEPRFFAGAAQFSAAQRPAARESLQLVPPKLSAAIPAPEKAPPTPTASPFAEGAPLPPLRPAEFASPASPPVAVRHSGRIGRGSSPVAAPPPDNRNFFEKLFGATRPSGPALAYASAAGGLVGAARSDVSGLSARYDRWTAVYDLAAHVVYLPDGTRLEAHSGLGDRLDDPAHVSERNRGATPPHVYELQAREELFHGVQALRLNPIGGGDIFGRAGLLAHSYMLGPNGDSNGCVSFRNYEAFLQAFQNGHVKRLAVVARLD